MRLFHRSAFQREEALTGKRTENNDGKMGNKREREGSKEGSSQKDQKERMRQQTKKPATAGPTGQWRTGNTSSTAYVVGTKKGKQA